MATSTLFTALVVVAMVLLQRTPVADAEGQLALGASLDTGPVPVVDSSSYDLSAHQTLSRVILLIRENYVDPARIKPYDMFLAALNHIQKAVPEVLVDDAEAPRRVKVAVGTVEQVFDVGGLDQLWQVTMALRDIFRFLQQHIPDPDERREVEYAAINGMLSTLDPHSVLLKPESFDEVKLSTKGEFGGLGIVISIRDGQLTVISPIEGTPASRSGLKAKDGIVKIGEESTINMTLEEAVHRLRGKPNTKVSIWVLRKGWTEPRKFTLTRAIIKIESVTSELLAGGVGYIKIKSFQNNTYDDLRTHLEKLRRKNKGQLAGLVLDLRNNPGGLLDQAIHISDRFIEKGPLVITVGEGNRKREVKQARYSGTESNYPIVTLVNGGSASASEIVSGALKNHDRAVVIGQRTFGKGSVQVLYDFKDMSALKLTIAQYLTPGDVSIQSVGITPHVEIVPSTISKEAIQVFSDRHMPREQDLEMHLERHKASQAEQLQQPLVRITHFIPPEELEAPPEEENPDAFKMDFEIELARELLARAKGTVSAKAILEKANGLFSKSAEEQDGKIAARFQSMGVDWSKGPKVKRPQAEVTLKTSAAKGTVYGGETLTLTATATNVGSETIHRMYGVTKSDNPLLANREFAFGKMAPGQSKTWSVDIKIPADISSRGDQVTLALGDQHHQTDAIKTATTVTMLSQKRPRFSFAVAIDDQKKGNGDGLLQVGEEVELKVRVGNLGPGQAKDVFVSAKNLSGESVFLEHGRDNLGEVKKGEHKLSSLRFSLRQQLEDVTLRLSVWDNELGSAVSQKIKLPVAPARKVKVENRSLKISSTSPLPIYAGASENAPVLARAEPGTSLKSTGVIDGEWRRVEAGPGLMGFVRANSVEVLKGKRSGKPVLLHEGEAAPELTLQLPTYITGDDMLQVKGSIKDSTAPKDVFVFVNDKKVFYQSLAPLGRPGEAFSMPLLVDLPLKEGSNAVAVVVRESDELVAREVFGVYRAGPQAIAEHTNDARPTHQ